MEFKPISGVEDLYEIASEGVVRSTRSGKILKGSPDGSGYIQVTLRANGKQRNGKVHRLVAEYFLPNPDNKPQVNHIDCNKLNNRLSNLEWCSQAENMKHACLMGRMARKLSIQDVRTIRTLSKKGTKQQVLASRFGVAQSAISVIINKKKWIHV